jgi:hypothetical protein
MHKIALSSCLVLASATLATAAVAKYAYYKHAHHRAHIAQYRAPAAESLTSVGTPDCHVQGRLLRAAHHCPPAAVASAPRVTDGGRARVRATPSLAMTAASC